MDFLPGRLRKPREPGGVLYAEDRSGRAGAEGAREQDGKRELVPRGGDPFVPGTFSPPRR